MPKRTKAFKVLPWTGGLNTSQDEGMIGPQDLVIFNNAVYGPKSSKLKRDGIDFDFDDASDGTDSIIALHDYWYESSGSKSHVYVGVTETGKIYKYTTAGARTDITPTAAAEVRTVTCPAKATLGTAQYFLLDSTDNTVKYYVWFDKSGTDTDPAVPGRTGVRVNVSTDTTADNVATRLNTAVDALAEFSSTVSTSVVTITNASNGPCAAATNVNVTGITISTTTQGTYGAWTTPTAVSMKTINNILVMAATGSSNKKMYWNGSNNTALSLLTSPSYTNGDPAPPFASIVQTHLGRLFTNDKDRLDRLHYSETFNVYKWGGQGDSGAIDIGVGDGDPGGITAIFPTFKGELFVAKKTKLYRVSGQSPDTFVVSLVSDSIGAEAHNAVVSADTEDIYWLSSRGIHSLAATITFGDFEAKFTSFKIQEEFNENWTRSRLPMAHGAYLPEINSVAFAVTYNSTKNNRLYLYNIPYQAWYVWPNLDCEAMMVATDSDRKRFYFGTSTTRLAKSFVGTNYDTNTSGTQTSIPYELETGLIFPENEPYMVYGYKTFALIHRPTGNQTITVNFQVDGYPSQSLALTVSSTDDLLGSTFILGQSILGTGFQLAPHALPVDGFGRGFKINVSQNIIGESAEIQGFVVEFEPAGEQQEVAN